MIATFCKYLILITIAVALSRQIYTVYIEKKNIF